MHTAVWDSDFMLKLCEVLPQQQQRFAGGRTNHDIRIVEAARETIVLCAGGEPRRGQAGQRLLSVEQAAQQLSQPLPVSVTLTQLRFSMKADIALGQRIRFVLTPCPPSVRVSASLCPRSVPAQECRDEGGVGGEPHRKKLVAKQRSNGQKGPHWQSDNGRDTCAHM